MDSACSGYQNEPLMDVCVSGYHSPSSEENESDVSGEDSDWEDVDEEQDNCPPEDPRYTFLQIYLDLDLDSRSRSIDSRSRVLFLFFCNQSN